MSEKEKKHNKSSKNSEDLESKKTNAEEHQEDNGQEDSKVLNKEDSAKKAKEEDTEKDIKEDIEEEDVEDPNEEEEDSKSEEKHSAKKSHKKHATEGKKHKSDDNDSISPWILVGILALIIIGVVFFVYVLPNLNSDKNDLKDDESIVAYVNDKPITVKEIDDELLILSSQYPEITREYVINQTIKKKLLLEEANAKGITINEEEIDAVVEEWATEVRKSVGDEALIAFLKEADMTLEDYISLTKRTYKEQALIFELLNTTVFSKLELRTPSDITDEVILKEFNDNKDSYIQRNMSFVWICYADIVGCENNMTMEEAKKKMDSAYKEIMDGSEFEDVVMKYGTLPELESTSGSELFSKEMLPENMAEEAFSLKVGEVSNVIDSEYGFFIVRVNDIMDDFNDYKFQISINMQFQEQMEIQQENAMMQREAMEKYISSLEEKYEVRNLAEERINKYEDMTDGIVLDPKIKTFSMKKDNEICTTADGKPIIYLFSTTWCPHCKWIGDTFNKVGNEYNAGGKVVVKHWELDTNDDVLTSVNEGKVPEEDMEVYKAFNERGSVPFYVFGCKYYRAGNGYESKNDLKSEEAEFRAVIDKVIAEAATQ